jgi:phage gp29-like protein
MKPTMGILGPDGRPVTAARVKQVKDQRFNPLANWTPDVLTMQLTAFQRGDIAALAWVMDWLEQHDDVISTVAPKAKAAVSRHGWDVLLDSTVTREQRGQAEDQRGVVERFYQTIQVGDAVEAEEHGGMRLLVQQVMDAYGKRYGAHHIIWRPGMDGIQAEIQKVPTWMFEVKEGRMRFLPTQTAQTGVELENLGGRSAWMTARGRGVMLAGVVARMFKQIPLQDWLTYCDRHGMPAFLGKTGAANGSPEWQQMYQAVGSIGSEFGAVISNNDAVEVLNLATQGELPYEKLVDRMDRAQVMLWRGGDLSTISRSDGVGSNPQQDEADELDQDNAVWVEETLHHHLTQRVIAWAFGPEAPVLVQLKLRTKVRPKVTEEMQVVDKAREMGVRVSKSWFVRRFGIVEADADEVALGEATAPVPVIPGADVNNDRVDPATALELVRAGLRADLKPLGDAIYQALMAEDSAGFRAGVKRLVRETKKVPEGNGMAEAMNRLATAALLDEAL